MRVAYFCDTFYPQINGVSNTLERLQHYTASKGIEAVFLAPHYPEGSHDISNVHRFLSFTFPLYKDCRMVLPPVIQVPKILDKFKPDVIHVVTEFGLSLVGINYARRKGIHVVSSYTTNYGQYLDHYGVPWLQNAWNAYLKWFHDNSRVTFCPSEASRVLLSEQGIHHTEFMRRGVDPNLFHPCFRTKSFREGLGIADESIIFTYVGRVAPEKDLDVLVKSIETIKSVYGKKAEFVIVGAGPSLEDLQQKLHGLAHFLGFVRGNALSEAYASSDVFVFPSTSETFGNVVLEAFASGLPAIVPNKGGVAELVTNDKDGFIVEGRHAEQFTQAIVRFIQAPQLIAQMRQEALKSAAEYQWEKVFDNLFKTYEYVIDEHNHISDVI